jgi:formylglycine-generating enzyme required for sulfatase activity
MIFEKMKHQDLLIGAIVLVFLFSGAFSLQRSTQGDEDTQKAYMEIIEGTTVSFKMMPIPAGEFLIGSPEDEVGHEVDEGPQKTVKIEAFFMMETELTWDLYELFIDTDKSATLAYASEDSKAVADAVTRPSTPYLDPSFGMGKQNYPAISMTQYSALVFCKWLSQITGRFYRLPTEAEWEYACRAGTTTAYSFGDNVDDCLNTAGIGTIATIAITRLRRRSPTLGGCTICMEMWPSGQWINIRKIFMQILPMGM